MALWNKSDICAIDPTEIFDQCLINKCSRTSISGSLVATPAKLQLTSSSHSVNHAESPSVPY